VNASDEETRVSDRETSSQREPEFILDQERFLTIQRYAEGISAALWILALIGLWIRIIFDHSESRLDQALFVMLLVSVAVQLFILIVRANRIKREPGWDLSHRLKRWGVLAAMAIGLLFGTLFTLFLRLSQWV
jgi:hypothetical protein